MNSRTTLQWRLIEHESDCYETIAEWDREALTKPEEPMTMAALVFGPPSKMSVTTYEEEFSEKIPAIRARPPTDPGLDALLMEYIYD